MTVAATRIEPGVITTFDLEPIKTALAAGDLVEARRQRVELLRDIIDELHWCVISHRTIDARGLMRVVAQLDALGIPDE